MNQSQDRLRVKPRSLFKQSRKTCWTEGLRFKSLISFFFLLILLFSSALVCSREKTSGINIPFEPGEKLIYQGRWGILDAGEVTMEVFPLVVINGVTAYHFVMTTRTSPTVDLIYKIRERQDSYVDRDITRSLLYKKRTESQHPRDEIVTFNWDRLEATYSNFGKVKETPTPILPGTFDPLAFFFALRMQDIKEKAALAIPVTDGNNTSMLVKATVGKRETIKIRGKYYDTYEINPDVDDIKDSTKRKENLFMKVWLTADGKKIPVKIHSKVGIMSFIFEIVSIGSNF